MVLFNGWHPDPLRRPSFLDIDRQFDSILVDCAVQDEYARRFWMREFGLPLRERVHWDEFSAKFFAFLQLPLPEPTPPKRPAPTPAGTPLLPTTTGKRSITGDMTALMPLTENSTEVNTNTCWNRHTHKHMHTHTTHRHTLIRKRLHTHAHRSHIYTHTHTRAHTYENTHTHIRTHAGATTRRARQEARSIRDDVTKGGGGRAARNGPARDGDVGARPARAAHSQVAR